MDGEEKWHLGIELHEAHLHEAPGASAAEPDHDPSARILERPLYVLTVEHLSYFLIAAWTIATRLLVLGSRPLTPVEAVHALFDLKLAQDGVTISRQLSPPYPLSMHLVEAWLFGGLGADDYVARLGFALGGVLMVAMAFALRRPLGRVGALALAVLLAISPSMTYFSRCAVSPIPALALTLAAIALFFAMAKRPTFLRAAAAAVATALALATDPTSYVTAAIFVVAALVFAVWNGIFDDTYFERVRYWWVRHGITAALAVAIGIAIWLSFEAGFWSHGIAHAVKSNLSAGLSGPGLAGYRHGVDFYLPIFALYEFLPVLLAIVGMLLFISFQLRSRFAGWCFIWTVASLAFYLFTPARAAQFAPAMLLPMAMLGALAIDYFIGQGAWRIVRYPLILLAGLTIYVALIVNFGFDVPDASEATWARHALLYWSDPATTAQARTEAMRLRSIVGRTEGGQGGGIFFRGDAPALRWYLRGLPTTAQAEAEAAIVAADAKGHDARLSAGAQTTTFELQDRWTPELRDASASQLLRYLFTQRVWSPVTADEAAIILPAVAVAPSQLATPVATPSAMPVPSPSPTATPAPSPSPSAQPAAALGGSPSATATPSAVETQMPAISPTPIASPSEIASPLSVITAIAPASATATTIPSATETPSVPSSSITPAATPSASVTGVMTTATPGAIESPEASPTSSVSVTPGAIPTAIKYEN